MVSRGSDPPIPQSFSPLEDMTDPQTIIDIGPNDVRFLRGLISLEGPPQMSNTADLMDVSMDPADDPLDLMDDQTSQSVAPSLSESAQHSETKYGGLNQKTKQDTREGKRRAPKASRRKRGPMGQQATGKYAIEKPKSKEQTKLMRKLGACLPCLVNHEPVSLALPLFNSCADIRSVALGDPAPGVTDRRRYKKRLVSDGA